MDAGGMSDDPTPTSMDDLLGALDRPAADPDVVFDAEIAAAMQVDAAHDEMRWQMRRLGERIGALHSGMVDEGMDPENASELCNNWLECAVFQRIARETGTFEH